ncbi:MAG: FAD-dependent monooxygenase [Pseudomonadota bacterium]
MTHLTTDILVAGGGIAGLSASCAFGAAGFRVTCVDPAPPITNRDAPGADLRSTAFLKPARDFLAEAGLWERMATTATALNVMRILDAGGAQPVARLKRDFVASDIGEAQFGYNVANTEIRRALLERIDELEGVDFCPGISVKGVKPATDHATVQLSDGQRRTARLLVAADGRSSFLREALGIGVQHHAFGQSALAFAVSHNKPHRHISTEVHRSGGPFTLVPLPDHQGEPSSAVVWMEEDARVRQLLELDEEAFSAAATERSAGAQGTLRLITRRTAWPIISQLANHFDGPRTALVAEAAHVMPPIGAQGLNTSLKDLKALLDLARQAPEAIGEPTMLRRYHWQRFPDVAVRVAGIAALNQISRAAPRPLRDARAAGLMALHGVAPVRKFLMRLGLGGHGDVG